MNKYIEIMERVPTPKKSTAMTMTVTVPDSPKEIPEPLFSSKKSVVLSQLQGNKI